MACNHLTDAKIIDYILGNLQGEDVISVTNQLDACHHCMANYEIWLDVLPQDEWKHPSPALKERTIHSFKKITEAQKQKSKVPLLRKASSVAIIAVALLSLFLLRSSPADQHLNKLNHESFLTMNPDTEVYELEPSFHLDTTGYALVNHRTGEIYLYVDGLPPVHNKDFQAWIKTHNGLRDVGIISSLNGKGQVYQKSEPLEHVEYIIFSLEPKGGSIIPSEQSSHIMNVKLKRKKLENF